MKCNQMVSELLRCFKHTDEGCKHIYKLYSLLSQVEKQVQLWVTFLINILTSQIAKDFGLGEL
jgi:lantibiotic modifying enzyme